MKNLKDDLFKSLEGNVIANSFYVVGGIYYNTTNSTGNGCGKFDRLDTGSSSGVGTLGTGIVVTADATWSDDDPGGELDNLKGWH